MNSLTSREREVVLTLAEGLSNKDVGRRLNLSEGTVKVHLHNIYSKLGVKNRTALVTKAHTELLSEWRNGEVCPSDGVAGWSEAECEVIGFT
jgi:DNA-binding NarL/FixJ family response regulator